MKKAIMTIVVCLGLLLTAVGCGRSSDSTMRIDAESGVSAAVALTEARVEGLVSTMKTMAMTDEVKSCEWETMENVVGEFQNTSIPLVAWFALPDGSYYTVDIGKASGNLSDRAYFPKVISGEIVAGDLIVSKSTGLKSMVVAVPVKDDGKVVGVLGVSVYLNDLSQMTVEDLSLPDDMFFAAVNESGTIALHGNISFIMENASDHIDLSGQVVSAQSPRLGWTFYLGFTK